MTIHLDALRVLSHCITKESSRFLSMLMQSSFIRLLFNGAFYDAGFGAVICSLLLELQLEQLELE